MQINQKGIALIKSFEGCVLNAYKDSIGKPTIGYGATFYQNGQPVKMGERITSKQADDLLEYHLKLFADTIRPIIKKPLNNNQFSALVSFAFNVGPDIDADTIPEGLGDSTLLKKVNANPTDPSIAAEFMKWNKAGGKVISGLTRRRKAEADLYFS